jgi:hypothetical protein
LLDTETKAWVGLAEVEECRLDAKEVLGQGSVPTVVLENLSALPA